MQEKKFHIVSFDKGMVSDTEKSKTIQGTYPYALNAVDIDVDGNEGFLQNEKGHTRKVDLAESCTVLGSCLLDDQTVVIFTKTDSGLNRIGLVKEHGTYVNLLVHADLDFDVTKQIKAEYKLQRNGNRIVYFTDNNSIIRKLNVDSPTITVITDLNLFSNYKIPQITKADIEYNTGKLVAGGHIFGFRYIDGLGNKSAFLGLTNPVPVLGDGRGATIGGAPAIEVPHALNITISNIDTNYNFIEIGVLTSDFAAKIIRKENIVGDTLSFKYTGLEGDAIDIDITELTVPQVAWEYAKDISQIDNRLLLANVASISSYNYQQYANNIKVNYVTRGVDYIKSSTSSALFTSQIETTTNFRSIYEKPIEVVTNKEFMRDEIYALGIQLIFNNGTESSVFHIPGRDKINFTTDSNGTDNNAAGLNKDSWGNFWGDWDSQTISASDDNNFFGTAQPRWKVENTCYRKLAIPVINLNDKSIITNEGVMGYYESILLYPNNSSWNSSSVGGEDLRNKPIRHHRIPDCFVEQVKVNNTTEHYLVQLKISNIELPESIKDEIQGFKIVIGKLTDENTSVKAKGLISNTFFNSDLRTQPTVGFNSVTTLSYYNSGGRFVSPTGPFDNNLYFCFYSPETLANTRQQDVDYLKIEREYYDDNIFHENFGVSTRSIGIFEKADLPAETCKTRAIKDIEFVYADALSSEDRFTRILDNGGRPATTYIELKNSGDIDPAVGRLPYTLKVDDGSSSTPPNRQTAFYYGSIKKWVDNMYGAVTDMEYMDTGHFIHKDFYVLNAANKIGSSVFYGQTLTDCIIANSGNAYVDWFSIKRYGYVTAPDTFSVILYFPTESRINLKYRYEGTGVPGQFYPKMDNDLTKANVVTFLTALDDNEVYFNPSYSNINHLHPTFGISPDTTSTDSLTKYTTRIAYSQKQNLEASVDAYKTFLAGNYVDLKRNKGQIWNLIVDKGSVYANTEHAIFVIPTGEQTIQTSQESTYIGTGAFFSITPQEVITTDDGLTGTISQWANISTLYGNIIIDSERGKIFMLADKLDEITKYGLSKFMDSRMRLELKKQLNRLYPSSIQFTNYDNPTNIDGIGYVCLQDKQFNRLIISKKDFKLKDESLFMGEYPSDASTAVGKIYTYKGKFFVLTSSAADHDSINWPATPVLPASTYAKRIYLTDKTYFYNHSFTVSYNPLKNQWKSFHSWIPQVGFNIGNSVFSANNTTGNSRYLYLHNDGDYGTYYRTAVKGEEAKDPFIIETVANPIPVKPAVYDILELIGETKKKDVATGELSDFGDTTFSDMIVYDSNQCSGNVSLDLPTGFTDLNDTVRKVEKGWRINNYRDLINNKNFPIWLGAINNNTGPYLVDKVLNNSNIDSSKAWYRKERFRDKWIVYRLIHDNVNATNINLSGALITYRISNR